MKKVLALVLALVMWIWNDYLLPYLVLDSTKYKTIPILIQYFRGSYGKVEMGPMMACIMRDGFVQQIGTPQEVFSHPANLFVAGFIGVPQMNFFDGRLKKDGEGYLVEADGSVVKVSERICAALKAGDIADRDVVMGIRPEHISLCDGCDPGAIRGKVDVSEMMGSSVHVHATVDGRDVVMMQTSGRLVIDVDQMISVT